MEEKIELNFAKEDTLTDIALIVEDKKLYTSKALLSMASPVFERMFFSDKHDKDNKDTKTNPKELDQTKKYEEIRHLLCVIPPRLGRNNSKTLDLHDKKYDDIRDLLCVIHPRVGRHVTDDMAFRLFPLADEYKMVQLKGKCEGCIRDELKKRTSDCSFLLRCLVMAAKFSLTNLWEETLQLCCPIAMESWRACPEMQNVPQSTQSILKILDKQRASMRSMESSITDLKSDLKTSQVELEQAKAQNRYLQQAPRSRSGFM